MRLEGKQLACSMAFTKSWLEHDAARRAAIGLVLRVGWNTTRLEEQQLACSMAFTLLESGCVGRLEVR